MLIIAATLGGALMIGSCLALAFEDVIEAKGNTLDTTEEKVVS